MSLHSCGPHCKNEPSAPTSTMQHWRVRTRFTVAVEMLHSLYESAGNKWRWFTIWLPLAASSASTSARSSKIRQRQALFACGLRRLSTALNNENAWVVIATFIRSEVHVSSKRPIACMISATFCGSAEYSNCTYLTKRPKPNSHTISALSATLEIFTLSTSSCCRRRVPNCSTACGLSFQKHQDANSYVFVLAHTRVRIRSVPIMLPSNHGVNIFVDPCACAHIVHGRSTSDSISMATAQMRHL